MPECPEDLTGHSCLQYTYADSTKYWSLENLHGEKRNIAVKSVLKADNGYLIRDAVTAGLGVAVLPMFIVKQHIQTMKLKVVLPEWQIRNAHISLLYPSRKYVSAKVRAFIELAANYYQDKF